MPCVWISLPKEATLCFSTNPIQNGRLWPPLILNAYVMTTLLKHYFAIKKKYPDAVLLFRAGDGYETFNEDAKILARHLGMTLILTETNPEITAAVSLPHYSLDKALHSLTKAGYKVAVCEQLEAPKAGPMLRGIASLFPE